MITHAIGRSSLLSKLALLVSTALALGLAPLASAATPGKTVNASATLAYNIKSLNHNLAIQKSYIASSYVYVTQRSGSTVYLSRCLISGTNATYQDEMTLTNCGHGQTLDMYTYNGINYLYVSSKDDGTPDEYWSLQVARLVYAAGTTVDYTSLHRFTYMNYANKTGTSLGTTYRVDAGGNSTHTAFRVQTTPDGTNSVTWAVYDTVALNQLLDANTQVQMNSAGAVNACLYSFTQTGTGIIRPNGSFQGMDLLGSTQIYTSGGAEGQVPSIALITNTGAYQSLVKITNVGNHEIEGVQTKNGNVYFVIVTDPVNKQSTQKIYYVSDLIF
ncbi:MAG: helveticin J family class III bacteriocin [Verrucomicrobia bacterium]|nr:helveticin J family class III bacteriocin [Verrucomicrobiota bacterium]